MTCDEFNEKYNEYLSEGHYGLDIDEPEVIEYLDDEFQKLIEIPNFKYYQIKLKFGSTRFYCDGVDQEIINLIEYNINELLR